MPRFLHVLNGDCTRGTLRLTGIAGDTIVWADVLYDGPVPDVPHDELRKFRGPHMDAANHALARVDNYDEVVFWFEHDLFDQLILIRHLHWLSRIERGTTTFALICIGAFPGLPNFAGLGELNPPQLASLFPTRTPITAQQVALGTRAWNLFRAPDPGGLLALVRGMKETEPAALPFLEGALWRFFEDFPATSNGLSRTEAQMLKAITEGHSTPVDIFCRTHEMEERIFMGDLTFWAILQALATAAQPLVTIEPHHTPIPIKGRVRLTPAGEDVLAGRADHIALNGIDKWMGGTHLETERHWRWDGARLIGVNSQHPTPNSQRRAD